MKCVAGIEVLLNTTYNLVYFACWDSSITKVVCMWFAYLPVPTLGALLTQAEHNVKYW